MSRGFLENLRRHFDWMDDFNSDRSIQFVHCARLRGNPLLIVRSLRHWMGLKTYRGTTRISWTETDRGPNGEVRTQTREQTLEASISRPFPCYSEETHVFLYSQAAPDLSFRREAPMNLAAHLAQATRTKEKLTRMANRQFDRLFDTPDRDHEIQYRLLFTPLAQEEMVKILTAHDQGFGPDFSFHKKKMVIRIWSKQLNDADIRPSGAALPKTDVDALQSGFEERQFKLFRSVYAALAPLLAIPLFQQHAPHWNSDTERAMPEPGYWELESIANRIGEQRFAHPSSETRTMLKVRDTPRQAGTQNALVTAHGFRSEARTTVERVRGGDGKMHEVAIHWREYFPVSRTGRLTVTDRGGRSGGAGTAASESFKDMAYAIHQ